MLTSAKLIRAFLLGSAVLVLARGPLALGQGNPVPLITEPPIPDAAAPGSPQLTLTVNGTGFASSSVVRWSGASLTTQFVSSSKLTATVPASDVGSAATASVTVFSPGPGGGTSNAVPFQVAPPASAFGLSGPQIESTTAASSIASGDLNGDGKQDLVVGNVGVSTVSVLLGNGDGTFQSPVSYAVGGLDALFVLVGDFNGDGKADIAAAVRTQTEDTGVVSVLLGNGDGTFQPHKDFTVGSSGSEPFWLAAADFNGDGRLDLAVADVRLGEIFVLLGNGDGTFQTPLTYDLGVVAGSVATGDFNGDGKLDLAVGDASLTGEILVLLGNGDGTFQSPVSYPTPGPDSLLTADVNGDGKLDLVGASGAFGTDVVAVLLGNGDGTFQPAEQLEAGFSPVYVALGDFNADGNLDLVVISGCGIDPTCSAATTTVSVLPGSGGGTFGQHIDFPTQGNPSYLAVGDFNGDGSLDVVTAAGSLSVLLQTPAALSPGELLFSGQGVGTTSPGQTVTLTNAADTTLDISSISLAGSNPGDYAESNTCGASLAAGANCTITVTFAPTAEGTRTALVSVADDAIGSPQQVALTGTGLAPVVLLSPSSLTFPVQVVGTTSAKMQATLTNTGNASLSITSIALTGTNASDFLERNGCGTSLAVNASCTISVQFRPKGANTRTAAVSITDNAAGSPQSIALTGQGTFFSLSPTSLTFAAQKVGTTSPPQTVTLTNVAKVAENLGGVRISGEASDFAQTNNCGTSVAAGGSCTFSVTFTPTKTGVRTASLQLNGGGGGVKSVTLSGTGD